MVKKSECPFCNLDERVLKSNSTAQAFLSNPRKVPGHFLVAPKRHVEKPWELKPEELQDIFELIFFVEQKLMGKLGDGVDVRQNYRPFKPQTELKANHVLFHVIPRYGNDYLYQVSEQYEKDLFTQLDPGEQEEFAQLLKG